MGTLGAGGSVWVPTSVVLRGRRSTDGCFTEVRDDVLKVNFPGPAAAEVVRDRLLLRAGKHGSPTLVLRCLLFSRSMTSRFT